MENFVYYIPTKVFFGKGQIKNLSASIKNAKGSRVLLAYGGGSIKKNGIYDDVTKELKKAGITYFELSDIKPNPRIESVHEGIDICRKNKIDFILAVGGGSTVDACKAISAGVNYKGDVFDLIQGKEEVKTALPIGAVLTLAATGTEMDCLGVISVGSNHKKYAIRGEKLYPTFSILDPQYTTTVSKYQTIAGCSDILSHLMEQYFVPAEYTYVQDAMNEGIMKTVIEYAPKLLGNLTDYNLRSVIMWASSMALAGVQFGLGKNGNWSVHAMGHEVSSLLDMTHGVTLA
ncbi:MAG TPA: iron-containing alcohol dehydrogenase, partial [Elusimicrobiales bacterium]|nr:iron-containing alcohol dehydrogenase [Elusimicrobiales bacterium]